MKERPAEDLLKTYARQVIASSERATAATRQLLTSRRKQIRQYDHVSLNEIVRDTEDVMRRLLGNAVRLEIVLADAEPVVWGDRSSLQRVMTSLTAHAKKTMGDGGTLTVTVKTFSGTNRLYREEQWSGRCAGVSFTYAGSGAAVGGNGNGGPLTGVSTGEGCFSVACAIVKQHHGSINVSDFGENGTVLSIYLPVVVGQDGQGTMLPSPAIVSDEHASPGEGSWPSTMGGSAYSR